jgi:SAM-dependent methyltransferase
VISDEELRERHQDVPPDYYDRGVRISRLQRLWHNRRRPVVERLLTGRGGQLLDLGCHGGYLTNVIAQASGAAVTGIDISPEAVAYARTHVPAAQFVVGDIQNGLPFRDGSFSMVTAFDVLEHVPHLDRLLREVGRVLVPGGLFVVGVPRETLLWRLVWALWTRRRGAVWHDVHVHSLDPERLSALLRQFGMIVQNQSTSHWGMYSAMSFVRQP